MKRILLIVMLLLCINVNGTTLFEVNFGRELKKYDEVDLKRLSNDIKEYKEGTITINQKTNIEDFGNYSWKFNDNVIVYYNMNSFSLNYNNSSPFITLGNNGRINVRGLYQDQTTSHNFNGYKEFNNKELTIINTNYSVYTNKINGSFIKTGKNCYVNLYKITFGGNNFTNNLINLGSNNKLILDNVDIINNVITNNSIINSNSDGIEINFKEINFKENYSFENKKDNGFVNIKGDKSIINIFNSLISNNELNNSIIYINGKENNISFSNTIISYNKIKKDGIIYIKGNKNNISSINISNNTVNDGTLYIDGNENKITDSEYNENNAINGGGIYLKGRKNIIEKSKFKENTAKYGYDIYNEGDYNELKECIFYRSRIGSIYEDNIILVDEKTEFKEYINTPKVKNKKNDNIIRYIYIAIGLLIILLLILFSRMKKNKGIIIKKKKK